MCACSLFYYWGRGGGGANAHDYSSDFNWDHCPLPDDRVQREEIYKVIANSLLSPSLDAIAVVRARPDTYRYVSGQGSANIWLHRRTFHYDYVFVAQTLYGSSPLPDQIAIIQPFKWQSSTQIPMNGRPDNFMQPIFDYSDEFSLVFLHRDHIFNHKPDYALSYAQESRDILKNIIGSPPHYEEGLGKLGLLDFHRDNAMHSLVEKYSCFRIKYQSHMMLDDGISRKAIPANKIAERYVLPAEFLNDLRIILQFLSSTGQTSSLVSDDLETDDGKEIFARISVSNPLPVLDAIYLRQETHKAAFESFLATFSGIVKDCNDRPVPSACVFLFPNNRMGGDSAVSSEEGVFALTTNRSYLPNGRLSIHTSKYAPSFVTLPAKQVNEVLKINLMNGYDVNFSIKTDPAYESHANQFSLMIFDASTKMLAYHLKYIESTAVQAGEEHPILRSLSAPVLLSTGDYILILADEDGGIYMIGKRFINGLEQPHQDVILDQNILNKVNRSIRIEETEVELLKLLGLSAAD